MPKIRRLETGIEIDVSETPILIGGIWECGSQRFTDPEGLEFAAVPVDPAIEHAAQAAAQWGDIRARRELLSDMGGYKVSVDGVDKWFHSDPKSKIQQLALVLMGASVASVPPWKTMDGSFVTMTQALAGQIFVSGVTMDGALFSAAESHRAAMEASAAPAAYDFSGNWPVTYSAA